MIDNRVHVIAFANEKGGTGKSTTAVHIAVALTAQGRKVALFDLDPRQRSSSRYLENRQETCKRRGKDLPMPHYVTIKDDSVDEFTGATSQLPEDTEFLILDMPGRNDALTKQAVVMANTIVTPINDSFVDLDLIGQVDAETYKVKRPSFFAELIFSARRDRAKADGKEIDWVVLRNRMAQIESRNTRRVGDALQELSRRVGFRVVPGLSERVIYREFFPSGVTLLDLEMIENPGLSHVAARQELRELASSLGLPA